MVENLVYRVEEIALLKDAAFHVRISIQSESVIVTWGMSGWQRHGWCAHDPPVEDGLDEIAPMWWARARGGGCNRVTARSRSCRACT